MLSRVLLASIAVAAFETVHAQGLNQGACDSLKAPDVTPGLYGLCVAYCEAIDCPGPGLTLGPAARKCRGASPKVLERYNNLKKDTDPGMPCIQPTPSCPCWNASELAMVGRSFTPGAWTFINAGLYGALAWDPFFRGYALVEGKDDYQANIGYRVEVHASTYTLDDRGQGTFAYDCRYINGWWDDSSLSWRGTVRVMSIQADEGQLCLAEVLHQYELLRGDGLTVFCEGDLCPP